eukprot:jgi/Mesen1/5220/ME000026S04528
MRSTLKHRQLCARCRYEDAYNRFVEEINGLAAYAWWEGCVHHVLAILAYPFAWSWQQWRRRRKVQRLREFVRSEYDHSCLRSCRSRALYEGLKVAATPDLLLGYIDVYLGGDEKRPDLPPHLMQRLPMAVILGGNGSYMAPFSLHSDNLLTSLIGQSIPATVWYRMVAGLNAQLRTVRRGSLRTHLIPVLSWLATHANPWLAVHRIRVDLAWFQATSSGYYQLGLLVNSVASAPLSPPHSPALSAHSGHSGLPMYTSSSDVSSPRLHAPPRLPLSRGRQFEVPSRQQQQQQQWGYGALASPPASPRSTVPSLALSITRRRLAGGIIDAAAIHTLEDRRDLSCLFALLLCNTRPVGHNAAVGLAMSMLLLADICLSLLTLLQFYSMSLAAFWTVLFVLPLTPLFSAAAGLNALFSHGPRRAAGLGRVYGLWNVTSLSNAIVALVYGFMYHYSSLFRDTVEIHEYHRHFSGDGLWWLLPLLCIICKSTQARVVDCHVANCDIQDRTLFSEDPSKFWET